MSRYDEDLPDAVAWADGLHLLPQHFQLEQSRTEGLVLAARQDLNAFHYGVTRFEADMEAAKTGLFTVLSIDAVMPDGTVIRRSVEQDEALRLDLSSALGELKVDTDYTLVLSVPARLTGMGNGEGRLATYQGPAVIDQIAGDVSERVVRARPRIALKLKGEVGTSEVTLDLIRFRLVDGQVRVLDYIPPTRAVTVASPIGRLVDSALGRMRAKARGVVETRTLSDSGPVAAMQLRLALAALVGPLLDLEVLLATGAAHPLDLYRSMARGLGPLTALVGAAVEDRLPVYDHDDPRGGFDTVIGRIDALLDRVQLAYRTLAFRRDGGGWELALDDQAFSELSRSRGEAGLLIGLFTPGTMETERVDRWMRDAIVSSAERIGDLQRARSLGLQRTGVDSDPETGILPPSGVLMYALHDWVDVLSASQSRILRIEGNAGDPARVATPTSIVIFIPTQGS